MANGLQLNMPFTCFPTVFLFFLFMLCLLYQVSEEVYDWLQSKFYFSITKSGLEFGFLGGCMELATKSTSWFDWEMSEKWGSSSLSSSWSVYFI